MLLYEIKTQYLYQLTLSPDTIYLTSLELDENVTVMEICFGTLFK